MKTELVLLTALISTLSISAQDGEPAPAVESAPDPAVAAVEEASQQLQDDGTDEIDLEEDDAALSSKKPQIKGEIPEGTTTSIVDIDCDDATLSDILRQFRKTTGANIISDDSTNLSRRVSVSLRRVPWLQGLQAILGSRGYRLDERGNIYFVSEDKQIDPVITKAYPLNHASAEELCKLFNESFGKKAPDGKVIASIANAFPEANVVVVNAPQNVQDECNKIIREIDKAVAQIYIEARFLELSSTAMHQLGLNWSTLKEWGVNLKNVKAGFGHAEGKAADYGTAVQSKSESANENESKSSNASTAADGSTTTSASMSPTRTSTSSENMIGLVPATIGSAAADAISAADMSWRDAFAYSGQLSADEFRIALSAFESLGEGKVFSNPKIIVANGKEAKVDMTTKEPNVTVEANYTGTSSQNMNISTKLEVIPGTDKLMFAGEAFFSYGITLSVKPRISPDGLINVEIVPTISEWKEDKAIKGASDQAVYTTYPKINVKRLTTNFTMKDGATAVIGGLTQTSEQDTDDGIPYLRKIPWIGPKLFGRKIRQKVQSEIIVFVTVGIANPQELPKNIGLPTNAIMGREYVEGKQLEPGFRAGTAAEVLALDTRTLEEIHKDPPKARDEESTGSGTVTITPSAN